VPGRGDNGYTTTHTSNLKGYSISLRMILESRTALDWMFRGSAYCQLIVDVNKAKRLEWAWNYQDDDLKS